MKKTKLKNLANKNRHQILNEEKRQFHILKHKTIYKLHKDKASKTLIDQVSTIQQPAKLKKFIKENSIKLGSSKFKPRLITKHHIKPNHDFFETYKVKLLKDLQRLNISPKHIKVLKSKQSKNEMLTYFKKFMKNEILIKRKDEEPKCASLTTSPRGKIIFKNSWINSMSTSKI